jgi:putative endonuclease
MYYVYVLQSQLDSRLYVGRSADLKKRLSRHNAGFVKSTKAYKPWALVYYEAYKALRDATKREMQLKQHAAKEDLKKQIQYSLKEL